MKRTATVTWHGPGKNGSGHITTMSRILERAPFTYGSRFEDKFGTNPEELIASAHAACFTMKLSFLISEAGYTPNTLETEAEVTLAKDSISRSYLRVKGNVPEMTHAKFIELVDEARKNCLVSRALNMEITAEADLVEETSLA